MLHPIFAGYVPYTGISYADLKNLTWKDIITEEDGSLWISMSRQKTGIPFNVKLPDINNRKPQTINA